MVGFKESRCGSGSGKVLQALWRVSLRLAKQPRRRDRWAAVALPVDVQGVDIDDSAAWSAISIAYR